MSEKLCGGCRHWGKPDESTYQFRSCTAVVHDKRNRTDESQDADIERDPEFMDDYDREQARTIDEFRAAHKVAAIDGSGFFAALRTREDFGCVLWEPKANPS